MNATTRPLPQQKLPKDEFRKTWQGADISDLVSEADKEKAPYLKGSIDDAITALVIDDPDLRKSYNFYNGERPADEFAYLADNYGLGSPAEIVFIPLIRKHIQVLLGTAATNPLDFTVTAGNVTAIDYITEQQIHGFVTDTMKRVEQALKNNIAAVQNAREKPNNEAAQQLGERALADLQKYYQSEWRSELEIALQVCADHHFHSGDMRTHFLAMLEDLLVCGRCRYRVVNYGEGVDPEFKALNPLNFFAEKNTNQRFIKNCRRVVYREYMTRQEIINRWGHEMGPEILEWISGRRRDGYNNQSTGYVLPHGSYLGSQRSNFMYGVNDGLNPNDSFPVYHVEWVANNRIPVDAESGMIVPDVLEHQEKGKKVKYRYRLDRYEGYRIGEELYVGMGKSKHVVRPVDKPWLCTLSYNGMDYQDRNGAPFSIVKTTKHIQDKSDILHYHLEDAVARAAGKGLNVYIPSIPVEFGDTVEERILKHHAYVKAGANYITDPQDGAKPFSNYGTYDLSLEGKAIEAIIAMLRFLEETACSITGVSRQALGQLEERDGLGNTKIAMAQTTLATKPFFVIHTEMITQAMSDMVNASRIAWRKGKKVTQMLGDVRGRIFTIKPGLLDIADANVFITTGEKETQDLERLKALGSELVQGQMLKAEALIDTATMRSLSQVKKTLKDGVKEQEQSEVQQLSQQLNELNSKLEEATAANQKFNADKLANDKEKLAIDREYKQGDLGIRAQDSQRGAQKDAANIELEEEYLELEREQLLVDVANPGNNEPKNRKPASK